MLVYFYEKVGNEDPNDFLLLLKFDLDSHIISIL